MPREVIQRSNREKTKRIIVDLEKKKGFILDGNRVIELEEKQKK